MIGVLAAATARAGTPAGTANDICASNANPCNVTSVFDIAPNSILDFGTRTVNVSGSGQLDFGAGSGRLQCGNLTATTAGTFLNASGPLSSGGSASGLVLLLARRGCSASNPVVPCLDGGDCQLGPCGVRRCSGGTTKTCHGDSDCQLGLCTNLKRCSLAATIVRCKTNADCDYGACPAQLTCTGRGDDPVSCASNADCSFGSCTVGTGSITMNGAVSGSSDRPATLVVRAADSISISKTITLNGATLESDGGSLSVDARAGSITLTSKINATGGGDSQGGSVELNAGTDIVVNDDIDLTGGDFDGGSIDVASGRDVTILGSLLLNSNSGAGYGGDLSIAAGRDLMFNGVSSANKSTMESSGHTDSEGSTGDGGSLELTADRDLTLDLNTRLIGNGSAPDGAGADMTVGAGQSIALDGDIDARASGTEGSGGYLSVYVNGGTISVGSTAFLDVTGGSDGGGFVDIDSTTGDLNFAGDGDVSGGGGGNGGSAFLTARQSADMTGTLLASGSAGGTLGVEACRVTLNAGATLETNGTGGLNLLTTHDDMRLLAGSSVTTDAGGVNRLRYRSAAKPPLVQGTVSPAPTLVVDSSLSDCPLCGNRAIDPGETCDDGNQVGGDGCSAQCQNENCVAQTISPGYPTVALCEDGNVCTADACNTTLNGGTCQHPANSCDDGIACTIDSCDAGDGTCQHSVNDSACDDNNLCTDDFCSQTTGCANTANSSPCDDNNRCSTNDVCGDKSCHGTHVSGCLFCGDSFLNPLGDETCDDGNTENGDCCDSVCHLEAASSPCEDGLFCTIDDECDGSGTCVTGPPNTCADTDVCTADSCNEDMAACVHAGTPRDASGCFVAPRTRFQIKNATNGKKDKLSWRWSHGEAFPPEALGAPSATTRYTLCVYDKTISASSLKASIDIAPSPTLWTSKEPSVLRYKDDSAASEGVRRAQLTSGDAGETDMRVGAGGANLILPSPAGTTFFNQNPNLVVQLVNDAGMCWTSQFVPIDDKGNRPSLFKAETK